jgi:arsenate reductase (glutaredoxin)
MNPSATILLHNPSCSKSRATQALLKEKGHPFVERQYLLEPLSVAELRELRQQLDKPAREWVRVGQAEYAAAGLSANASDEEHFAAMAAHPILMERPIVIHQGAARIGRPPHAVLELFEDA